MVTQSSKDKSLTNKQIAFVAHYLTCWNAAEAARRAGYPEKSAREVGYENLTKPHIRALIDTRMAEQVMSANEVLSRLSQMASANLIDILDADDEFDFELAREKGMMHLVKKLKRRQFTDKEGNTTRETEIECYNAQDALVTLAKHHGLLVNKIEMTFYDSLAARLNLTPAEARELAGQIARGEITIGDVLTGKAKVRDDASHD